LRPLEQLDKDTILDEEIFIEVYEITDKVERERLIQALEVRADNLGVKTFFNRLKRAYAGVEKEINARKALPSLMENWTNFTGKYDNMQCGGWIATDGGIFFKTNKLNEMEQIACYHPILPLERMKNLETGEEQIKLAYKRNGQWFEIVTPKTTITSNAKIVGLSSQGVSVTSETARLLVKYLADVENANEDYITVQISSSKLGWRNGCFLPYDNAILFDGDLRFKSLYDSIQEHGIYDIWLEHVKELRSSNRLEIKFLLAASFSSILVSMLGALPFIVDLWGETEGGKTVTEMLAASVWANPSESVYIGDFKSTEVVLEVKADMLNHLPMIFDDTSKVSAKIRENFEGFVYDLCSGKGKSRSNRELGVRRENTWKNVIITNGERPLQAYVTQGGAINRILEVECHEKVYEDAPKTADIIKANYGFAGKRFVEIVKEMGVDSIKIIQKNFLKSLANDEKMQKQSIALSVVLTADKIINDHIFQDDRLITLEEASTALIDRTEVSDNERCYEFIQDKIAMNYSRFDATAMCEKWGILEEDFAYIFPQALDEICKSGGFSRKSFTSWASKRNLIVSGANGKTAMVKKIAGKSTRCICLKRDKNDGFEEIDETDNIQFKLPFD